MAMFWASELNYNEVLGELAKKMVKSRTRSRRKGKLEIRIKGTVWFLLIIK